jgi:membrane-bound lytic murein transglycosylase B
VTRSSLAIALPLLLACSNACLAIDNSRPEVRAFIKETARDYPIKTKRLKHLLAQAQTKQSILDAISKPAERVTPWYEYSERFMTDKRIQEGTNFWTANRKQLDAVNDAGIAATVAGILGVETSFGRITGRYRVLDALATLAFDYPARGEFFRGQLQQFLLLAQEEHINPTKALGSYAGAMGSPQFMPSSYRSFAVDGDHDGKRDLWSSWDDVIGSVANYLRVHGWRDGEPVVADAALADPDLSRFDMSTIALNETVASLHQKGVLFDTTLPADSPAMLIVLQGREGPLYRVGFNNFFVITRYNRSSMYANAVHDLGDALLVATRASKPQDSE